MKKNKILKVMTCALCLTVLMSTTAFAAEGPGNLIQGELQTTTTAPGAAVEDKSEYVTVEGTITEAGKTKDYYTIKIDNDDMGMVFTVEEGVFVIDQKTGAYLQVSDLVKGMNIVAVVAKNSPMTLSIPPQTPGAVGFVVKSEASSVDVSIYNDELINADNTLKLNISDKTQIAHINGSKMAYKEDSLKGSECLVLYTVSTRSIPAQTTPEFVMLLNTADELVDTGADLAKTETEASYVELRTGAEAKGYEVKWTSNKAPIVLTKGDKTVEITIGSDAFTFTHMTMDLQPLDNMEKLDMPVKLENGKTMVPNSFIEAL